MKKAIQLYSFRETLLNDMENHFRKLKEMGYDGAEFLNFGGDSVDRIAEEMKKAGLEVFSIMTDINEMKRCDEKQVAHYADLGCRFIPICSLPIEYIYGGEKYEETLEVIRKYSELCKKYGIKLLFHNHDFDLEMTDEGRKLDLLYRDTDPDVLGAELDTCWIYTAGEDPVMYMKKYGSRCPVLHLKDCVKEGGRAGFRAVGEGVLDFDMITDAADELGVEWLCVEQDTPSPEKTPMECAKMSIDNLKKIVENKR